MKTSSFPELDKASFIWLLQMREKCIPVTGPILSAKARDFYPRIYPDSDKEFTASKGFLSNFCKRNLSIQGEKISADKVSAESFVRKFKKITEGYSKHQIFNADETGLFYKCLTNRTFVTRDEYSAPGRKFAKDSYVEFMCKRIWFN